MATETSPNQFDGGQPAAGSLMSARLLAQRCAAAAFGIALVAGTGWLVHARWLAGQWGHYVPTAPSSALAIVFLSSGVYSNARWPEHRLYRRLALAAAALTSLLGLLVLVKFFTGFSLGVEQMLSRTNELLGGIPLGRMSPLTAASLLLESATLLLLLQVARWRFAASGAGLLALLSTVGNLVTLIGYIYGAPLLYGSALIPQAWPSALAFALIGVSQCTLALHQMLALSGWVGNSTRGLLLRTFLPGVLLVILVEGWLNTRELTLAKLNPALWHSLVALVACAVLIILIGWTARRTGDALEQADKERDRLQGELTEAHKLESVGRLAGGVAHEFNNLLTVINGYAGFLAKALMAQDALRNHALQIEKAGERAAKLVSALLAFSRKQILRPRALDLNTLVAEAEAMLPPLLGEEIELATCLAPDLGLVKADPNQLHQVILNLALNARDAMPGGGKLEIATANVDLTAAAGELPPDAAPGPYVRLTITDTGTGMTEEVRQKIFEPFFTTKELGKGTGLGLSMVYGIMRQSAGWIEAKSAVEQGSIFHAYLPRIASHTAMEQD